MSLDRREMLRMGSVGASAVLLSSAASSVGLPALVFRLPPATPATVPLPSTLLDSSAPAGIDPRLFSKAKAALDSRRWIAHRDVIGIVDFAAASAEPRFHLVNLLDGSVVSHRVAHGRGSDPDHSGYVERFSNNFGSEASSSGAYVTAGLYDGKYGTSMKVQGLDWSNNNAASRAIVIHNAWYAEDQVAELHGKLGRSEGCFAFSRASQWDVMSRLADGRLIYADKLA
ncbi:murein L,D-transpeptidase catalytic domain-containing protein [Sphingomonas sp.]|uniref:murein L,D-transpeptidase catalytic domain-containing protein n=1 Tax=Sphingomonas sp. TaxID=28214 RepID=UPI00286A3D02|nr:murein L,D-transpeptidase catalytic domain family protein [Sphingomonas sp.]